MIRRMFTSSLALLLFIAAARADVPTTRPVDSVRHAVLDASDARVLIVAHRGLTVHSPENSVAAIRDAADAGADVVEIDVRKTSDGHYVLSHDAKLDRATTMKGEIAKLPLATIRTARLLHGVRPSTQFVPTLDDAFNAARGRVMLNLDPKAIDLPEAADLARKAGMIDHCLFKQTWAKVDDATRQWLASNPDVIFMPICASLDEVRAANAFRIWPMIEVTFATPEDSLADPKVIADLRRAGTRLWINPLWNGRIAGGWGDEAAIDNPAAVFAPIVERGYGAIQTDLAELAIPFARLAKAR